MIPGKQESPTPNSPVGRPGGHIGESAEQLAPYESTFAALSPRDFAEFVRIASPHLYSLLRWHYSGSLGHADLAESIGVAIARAWIHRGAFDRSRGSLWGWLWSIANRAAIDILRDLSKHPSRPLDGDIESPDGRGSVARDDRGETPSLDRRTLIARQFLDSLNPRDRRIVEGAMSDVRGWTKEIADELATTPGAVRVRWLRLRRDLVARFEAGERIPGEASREETIDGA